MFLIELDIPGLQKHLSQIWFNVIHNDEHIALPLSLTRDYNIHQFARENVVWHQSQLPQGRYFWGNSLDLVYILENILD